MRHIQISQVPHKFQRYDTLGDYVEYSHDTYAFFVSVELGDDYGFLVAVHELIEAYLCKKHGVSFKSIDAFDREYEARRVAGISEDVCGEPITDASEPGDSSAAPYFHEHQFATKIEKELAHALGISWQQYEADCVRILNNVDHPDRHKHD